MVLMFFVCVLWQNQQVLLFVQGNVHNACTQFLIFFIINSKPLKVCFKNYVEFIFLLIESSN